MVNENHVIRYVMRVLMFTTILPAIYVFDVLVKIILERFVFENVFSGCIKIA